MVKEKAIETKNEQETNMVAGLDINDIIKKAQSLYDKSEKGLSKQLSTGITINRPVNDSDFIVWQDGNFWKDLTGVRGIPMSKFVEIAGLSNSGKSTMAAQFITYAQQQGCFVILFDSEQKFAAKRFKDHMGGDPEKLLIVDTNSIIDGCKGVTYLVKAIKDKDPKAKILIVVDSIGAAINSTENNEENESLNKQPGVAAKEISFMIRKFARLINQYQDRETNEYNISVLCINQVYAKIGFMMSGYQEKGGATLEYLSSLIIILTRKKDLVKVKNGQKIKYGILSKAKVKKNHLFDGTDCLSEIDIVVDASGIRLADEVKKKESDIQGWDDKEESIDD